MTGVQTIRQDQDQALIPVEVAYATADKQLIIELEVPDGTTALEAVRQSRIVEEFPDIDPERDPMGIFSNLLNGRTWPVPSAYRLQPRDRVEIYRPLQIDPKAARLARAGRKSVGGTGAGARS
jgi:putative ubiquitin-RnfH superfamily antitoxin RatB of RatAB toxin-antitoxin module